MNYVQVPFAMIVHAVESIPLCVKLCQSVPDLCGFSMRSFLDDVGVPLVDPRDLIAQILQTLLDNLKDEQTKVTRQKFMQILHLCDIFRIRCVLAACVCCTWSVSSWLEKSS